MTDRIPPRNADPIKFLPADADPNAADSLDTILVGAESIQIIPAGTDPVTTVILSEEKAVSTSEKEAIEDKDSQNASPPASDEKEYVEQALQVLAPECGVTASGPTHPTNESNPRRRLLLRLVRIGRRRLIEVVSEEALLVEPLAPTDI